MDLLSCRKYGEVERLRMDLDFVCWEEDHMWAVARIAIPCLIIHVIGVPLLVAVDLYYKYQASQVSESNFYFMMQRYGFLVAGYSNHVYGWELTVMARKFLIVVACVFLGDEPTLQVTFVSW